MNGRMRALGVLWVGSLLFLTAAIRSPQIVTACGDFGQDLVGWWKMDDGVGLTVSDSSGLGNDGQIRGAAGFTTDALLGTAVDFMGASGLISVAYDPSLEPAVGTVEAWVKVANLQDSDVLTKTTGRWVRTGGTGTFAVYGLRIHEDGSVSGYIGNDDPEAPSQWTIAQSPPDLITLGEWHHLAMRWDGASLDLFVDGKIWDRQLYLPVPDLGLSYFGGQFFGLSIATFWANSGDHELIGQVDDVRMYARARPDREIRADYKSKGKRPAKPLEEHKKKAKKKHKKHHKKHHKHEKHKKHRRHDGDEGEHGKHHRHERHEHGECHEES